VFGKNYGWSLRIAKNMYKIFGESVVTIAFQSVFYLEMHQNNIFLYFKIYFYFWYQRIKMISNTKIISIWSKEKNIKKINFFQKRFWNTKINKVLRNSIKKTCKNYCTKTVFQTQIFNGPRSTKHNLICYQTLYFVCFTANATQKLVKIKLNLCLLCDF
jgi:DNA integrity scanning protein DisA with diadenylate cyclase activity